MGRIGRKPIELSTNHIVSDLYIHNSKYCKDCPIRLYKNESDKVILGIGNIFTDTIIVLPTYDIRANIDYITMLDVIKDAYKLITDKDIFEDYYITRSTKCYIKSDIDFGNSVLNKCINYINYEITKIKPRKIICFDKRIYDYLCYYYPYIRNINVISPAVMFYDNKGLKTEFVKQFKTAIYV